MSAIKDRLQEYRQQVLDIRAALRKVDELKEQSLATGSLAPKHDKVIASYALAARFEELIGDAVDLEQIIGAESMSLETERRELLAAIHTVKGHLPQKILKAYYLDALSAQEIADGLDIDIRSVFRIKKQALAEIEKNVKLKKFCIK